MRDVILGVRSPGLPNISVDLEKAIEAEGVEYTNRIAQ